MGIYMVGSGAGGEGAFNRSFFSAALGNVIENNLKDGKYKLTLSLADGSTINVCSIDEMGDQYMTLHTFTGDGDECSMSITFIPYNLIYRIELTPKGAEENERVGFRWSKPQGETTTKKKTAK